MWIFRPSKLHWKEYVETTQIFRPSKFYRKKYVETTWIFWPSKLHPKSTWKERGLFDHWNYIEKVRRNKVDFLTIEITSKKYLERTWTFRPLKLHRKSTRKWRANSSKFGLWYIDVISTSNQGGFYVVRPLDFLV